MIRPFKNKIVISFIIFICIFAFSFLIPSLRSGALAILKLPLKIFTLMAREINAAIFYHRNYVENIRLRKDNDILMAKLNMLNELYLENIRLKEMLGFKQGFIYKLLGARVIGHDPTDWSSVIIIDKGKDSGIKENQLVVTHLGLAGKIIEVGYNTSKVMLINDPHINIPVIIQRSRQDGLVTGTLQDNLVMKYLAYDADINIGDTVVTSGLDDVYPKGLLVGKVRSLSRDATGLSRYAIIEPAVKVSRLEEVLVVFK
ncbi:MAG: rod shape-determining protein MreC [Candidatus Omnitrophica bacterium]|nr:rod shape-determining protein MreC [Candidatus Omnitrophota bacterium]MCM8771072.1 rod shape-determining protein MreC [Candidatus Omnitrophota bacterium]